MTMPKIQTCAWEVQPELCFGKEEFYGIGEKERPSVLQGPQGSFFGMRLLCRCSGAEAGDVALGDRVWCCWGDGGTG